MKHISLPVACAAVLLLTSSLRAQTVIETFETFTGLGSSALNLSVLTLDENTIALGQGPNLVLDGCEYSCLSNSLQWDGAGYFGAATQALLANSGDGLLTLTYDTPVTYMKLDLLAFNGYADLTVVTVFDGNLLPIFTSAPISVPDANGVPFSHSAASIGKVTIQSTVYSWSTIIDNHEYSGTGSSVSLARSGTCPGPMVLKMTGGTAGGNVAFLYGQAGSFVKNGNPCSGLTLGLANPTLAAMRTANGAGTATLAFNAPPGACGRSVQAVDVASCTASNALVM